MKAYHEILKQIARDGHLKPYAFYLILRDFAKKNHTIYDYSPERFSKIPILDGMNPKTVDKYVKILQKYKLVDLHNGNLFFRNQLNLLTHTDNKRKYTLRCRFFYPEVVEELYKLILLLNKTQQEYNIETKNADRKVESEGVHFSTRSIARLIGRSHTTANTIVKKLVEKGKIKAFQIIKKIKAITYSEFAFLREGLNSLRKGFYFFRNGYLYLHEGLHITIGH